MTTYIATGSPTTELSTGQIRDALQDTFSQLGLPDRTLLLPPDQTRSASGAGEITSLCYQILGSRITDIMPALGTHRAMSEAQISQMFPAVPLHLFREHRWRTDVVSLGQVPAEFVKQATEGIYEKPWPAQVNRLVRDGGHDRILSIGQVVPHEVIGMANYNKNLFVGTGGTDGINESHFLSAVYGMERIMGRTDTPLRKILNYAQDYFCKDLPVVYVLTVIEPLASERRLVTRGLFIGDDYETFVQAAELSAQVNCVCLPKPVEHVVAYLDQDEFHSTWLGNKAIYRTRMAIASGGRLTILAPGVDRFGEDQEIDRLIRKYGYRTSSEILTAFNESDDLANHAAAAAHLIHGSAENRFEIVYCPGGLTADQIEGVGYQYADLASMQTRYRIDQMQDGWNVDETGNRFYFIRNPGLGLWTTAPSTPGGET